MDKKQRRRRALLDIFEARAHRYDPSSPSIIAEKMDKILMKPVLLESIIDITSHLKDFDYAIVGGMAITIHAKPRNTSDIDLLVRPSDIPFIMEKLGISESTPLTVGGVSLQISDQILDLITLEQKWAPHISSEQYDKWVELALQEAAQSKYGKVLSKPHLVLTKLLAGRAEHDDYDIINLLGYMDDNEVNQAKELVAEFLPNDIEDFSMMADYRKEYIKLPETYENKKSNSL